MSSTNDNKKETVVMAGGAGRMNAKETLRQLMERERKQLHALEILLTRIPWHDLHPHEEETLWSFFIQWRR